MTTITPRQFAAMKDWALASGPHNIYTENKILDGKVVLEVKQNTSNVILDEQGKPVGDDQHND